MHLSPSPPTGLIYCIAIIDVCDGGTSAGSIHSVIISNDARLSGRTLKRSPLPMRMAAVPAMTVPPPDKGERDFSSFAFAVLSSPHPIISTCGVTGFAI